jgi:transcriptional regulator GlxA family with amidase domain
MAPYRVALLFEAVQLSDIVGVDLFGNCSTTYLNTSNTSFPIPPNILSQGLDMEFLYISSTLEPASATPDIKIVPTHTYDTCPRDVDLVLIGGPLLTHRPEASLKLMREITEEGKGKKGVVIMTTCVGSMWLASSGVLKGRKVTTNRFAIEIAEKLHPDTEWMDRRWVVDQLEGGRGEIWTSGGAGCGMF